HLCKVRLACEHVFNPATIEMEAIRRQLKAMFFRNAIPELSQKFICRFAGSLADGVGGNQLRFRVDGYEHPSIAKFFRVILAHLSLLLANERPNLIALNMFAAEVPHPRVHQGYTTFPGENQQPEDRIAVKLRDAFCTANARSFNRQLKR